MMARALAVCRIVLGGLFIWAAVTKLPDMTAFAQDVDAAFWGWNRPWLDPEFRKWNLEEFLPRISAPILVVQGEQDEYGTHAQVGAIERGARDVEVLMLPHCGHSPHRDQAEATLRGIAAFVRKHVKPGS